MYFSKSSNSFFPDELMSSYKESGTWPKDAVKVSPEEWKKYSSAPPLGMNRGADEDGHPTWVPIPPPALDVLASRKRRKIDDALADALAAGMPYDIGGETDVVQTRPQDQINLLGLSSKAQRLIADGVTDAVMPFRGQSNVTRLLTPERMDAMTLDALEHIEGIYQRSWDRKGAIDQALASEDREALESVKW